MKNESIFESMCSYLNERKNGVITVEADFLTIPSRLMMKVCLSVGDRHVCRSIPFDDIIELSHNVNIKTDSVIKRVFEDMCDTIDKMEAGDESLCY